MTEIFLGILKIVNLFMVVGLCGAIFGVGFAGVCRLLKWSPVNVTVNVNMPDKEVK